MFETVKDRKKNPKYLCSAIIFKKGKTNLLNVQCLKRAKSIKEIAKFQELLETVPVTSPQTLYTISRDCPCNFSPNPLYNLPRLSL